MRKFEVLRMVTLDGPLSGVQDTFGKTWKLFAFQCVPGSIVNGTIRHEDPKKNTAGDKTISRYKIIAAAHPNTIRAFLRKSYSGKLQLGKGYWYEVHTD